LGGLVSDEGPRTAYRVGDRGSGEGVADHDAYRGDQRTGRVGHHRHEFGGFGQALDRCPLLGGPGLVRVGGSTTPVDQIGSRRMGQVAGAAVRQVLAWALICAGSPASQSNASDKGLTCSMSQGMPYCNKVPTGSVTNASVS
jgi:hypothetical protein